MKSNIHLEIELDDNKMPSTIHWEASDTGMDKKEEAKAMFLSLWDGKENTALRIDLWTKKMMVNEMNDFYFQTLMSMADTYHRSTGNENLRNELKSFAENFYKKAQESISKS